MHADRSASGGELARYSRGSEQTSAVRFYVVVRVSPRRSRFRSEISSVRRMCVVAEASRYVKEQLLCGGVLEHLQKLARNAVLLVPREAS